MIFEGVITTTNEDGSAHVTPMGFVRESAAVTVAPFVPSTTLDNLRRHQAAVMSLTDDVRIIAGSLTGRRDWPVVRAMHVDGWRLKECLARGLFYRKCKVSHLRRNLFGWQPVESRDEDRY